MARRRSSSSSSDSDSDSDSSEKHSRRRRGRDSSDSDSESSAERGRRGGRRRRRHQEDEDEDDDSRGNGSSDSDSGSSSGGGGPRPRRRRRRGGDGSQSHGVAIAVGVGVLVLLVALGVFLYVDRASLFGAATSSSSSSGTGTGAGTGTAAAASALTQGGGTAAGGGAGAASTSAVAEGSTTPAGGSDSTPAAGASVAGSSGSAVASPSSSAGGNSSSSSGSSNSSTSCFPLGSSTLPSTGAPSGTRANWWCANSEMYGYMGFSYPLEDPDCTASTNTYDAINKDMANMKSQFGASMVRIYAPECRQVSVWEALAKACITNNMGMIVQVWWGFDTDQNEWKETEASIYSLFTNSSYASVAPFLVHSASFGSEPIGDGVDGSTTQFVTDLKAFRTKMNGFGIPVGISEDWDRPGIMSTSDGSAIGPTGKLILAATDMTHAHVMPYYHPDEAPTAASGWTYTVKQLAWLRKNLNQPTFLTEVPWSSSTAGGGHSRGSIDTDVSIAGFTTYWDAYSANCSTFKQYQVGWFMHCYDENFEPGFGMLDSSEKTKIAGWRPPRC